MGSTVGDRPGHADGAWLPRAAADFEELLALPAGWDTYGAPRIDAHYATLAFDFLAKVAAPRIAEPPAIVPTPHRGVQVEWHVADLDLELTFDDKGCFLLVTDPTLDFEAEITDPSCDVAWTHALSRFVAPADIPGCCSWTPPAPRKSLAEGSS